MTAQVISGAAIAADIRVEVADRVRAHLAGGGVAPQLTAILVGDDPASATYVRNKARACEEVGLDAQTLTPPADISQDELLEIVRGLNADPTGLGHPRSAPAAAAARRAHHHRGGRSR